MIFNSWRFDLRKSVSGTLLTNLFSKILNEVSKMTATSSTRLRRPQRAPYVVADRRDQAHLKTGLPEKFLFRHFQYAQRVLQVAGPFLDPGFKYLVQPVRLFQPVLK